VLFFVIIPFPGKSQETPNNSPGWSTGLFLGPSIGIVVKNEFSTHFAFTVGSSYSFNKMGAFYFDWNFHFPSLLRSKGAASIFADLEIYFGMGAAALMSLSSETRNSVNRFVADASYGFLLRTPVGIQYIRVPMPLAVFVELVPGVIVYPATFPYFGLIFGLRYYF
jgi:hypothetical protein